MEKNAMLINPLSNPELLDTGCILYSTGEWQEDGLGSQRAVVRVDAPAKAVLVKLPWRRRDALPVKKDIRIFDISGQRVANLFRKTITRELGEIIFEPTTGAGDYFIYFMPCHGPVQFQEGFYYPAEDTADPAWLESIMKVEELSEAHLLRFEARTEFDRRDPMDLVATQAEVATLLANHPGEGYLLFLEDRLYPLRMTTDLPYRWVRRGPSASSWGRATSW